MRWIFKLGINNGAFTRRASEGGVGRDVGDTMARQAGENSGTNPRVWRDSIPLVRVLVFNAGYFEIFCHRVLSRQTDLREATRQLPLELSEACWRFITLLESIRDE